MAYTVKNSKGDTVAVIPDKQIDKTSTSLELLGRRAVSYGLPVAENFVHLLENFASPTEPEHPIIGQLWYDTEAEVLKIYRDDGWSAGLGYGGVVIDPDGNGSSTSGQASGVYILNVPSIPTHLLVFMTYGKIVACISPVDIAAANLPATYVIDKVIYEFASRFTQGLEAGVNLADDPAQYVYNGLAKLANQAYFAGGGSPIGGWTYVDIGAHTLALIIADTEVIVCFADATIAATDLPTSIDVLGQTVPLRARFPNGLISGMTFAANGGISLNGGTIFGGNIDGGGGGGGITLETVQQLIGDEATARASAVLSLQTYADETFAQASAVTEINAAFTSATGQSSLSNAISYLIASAGSGTANAEYVTQIHNEIQGAIPGATSYTDALNKLKTTLTASTATSQDVTTLVAGIKTGTGQTNLATAVSNLATTSNINSAIANYNQTLTASTGALGSLAATVTTQAGAISTLNGKTSAYFSVDAVAASRASLSIVAAGASAIDLYADSIKLKNATGGLTVSGGQVLIDGKLKAGSVTADMLNIGTASGARITVETNVIKVFDANGTLRVRLGVF